MGVGAHWAGGGLYLVKLGVGELADGFLGASLGAEDVVGEVVDGGDTAVDERLATDEAFGPLVESHLYILKLIVGELHTRELWEEVLVRAAPKLLHCCEVESAEKALPFG